MERNHPISSHAKGDYETLAVICMLVYYTHTDMENIWQLKGNRELKYPNAYV